jgi:hypothetical protein
MLLKELEPDSFWAMKKFLPLPTVSKCANDLAGIQFSFLREVRESHLMTQKNT